MKRLLRNLGLPLALLLALGAGGQVCAAQALSPRAAFARGVQAWQKGAWAAAAQAWRQAADQGVDDAVLWYDLGNAGFKLGDLGRARVCYERALLRAPRDPDVRHNLALLERKLPDRALEASSASSLGSRFTLDELAVVAAAAWWIGAGALLWFRRRRGEGSAWIAGLSLLVALGAGGLLASRIWGDGIGSRAVVIPARAGLYNGPGKDYPVGVQLHAGTLVRVFRQDGDWCDVGAFRRARGWVRAEQLERIQK